MTNKMSFEQTFAVAYLLVKGAHRIGTHFHSAIRILFSVLNRTQTPDPQSEYYPHLSNPATYNQKHTYIALLQTIITKSKMASNSNLSSLPQNSNLLQPPIYWEFNNDKYFIFVLQFFKQQAYGRYGTPTHQLWLYSINKSKYIMESAIAHQQRNGRFALDSDNNKLYFFGSSLVSYDLIKCKWHTICRGFINDTIKSKRINFVSFHSPHIVYISAPISQFHIFYRRCHYIYNLNDQKFIQADNLPPTYNDIIYSNTFHKWIIVSLDGTVGKISLTIAQYEQDGTLNCVKHKMDLEKCSNLVLKREKLKIIVCKNVILLICTVANYYKDERRYKIYGLTIINNKPQKIDCFETNEFTIEKLSVYFDIYSDQIYTIGSLKNNELKYNQYGLLELFSSKSAKITTA
eukprot:425426_1